MDDFNGADTSEAADYWPSPYLRVRLARRDRGAPSTERICRLSNREPGHEERMARLIQRANEKLPLFGGE